MSRSEIWESISERVGAWKAEVAALARTSRDTLVREQELRTQMGHPPRTERISRETGPVEGFEVQCVDNEMGGNVARIKEARRNPLLANVDGDDDNCKFDCSDKLPSLMRARVNEGWGVFRS